MTLFFYCFVSENIHAFLERNRNKVLHLMIQLFKFIR
jgi:hypothetical protein